MLDPDAFGNGAALAAVLQGALGAAEQVSHALFGDLVDVTGTLGFHGMVSTPPVAAGWCQAGILSRTALATLSAAWASLT